MSDERAPTATPEDSTPETGAPEPTNPLAEKIRRAIAAHPILRGQKKLEVVIRGRRVHVQGVVFTRHMHRQLVELLRRIPGAEQIAFTADPEIQAPQKRDLEGRVPGVSQGPSPSNPRFSVERRPRP